jgi:asparagine synthase (glutamine-hydrolysing)
MCGINGIVSLNKDTDLSKKIDLMNNLIIHRGPDDYGNFLYDDRVSMGMRRLSIIDLNCGSQPIMSEDNTKVIVFNGEIYNFNSLRKKLVEAGFIFKTNTDTEVILKLYEKEGPSSFGKLDGMFAFSIYDKTLNKIYIARDFFGEKPLFYTIYENKLIWSSELKSIISVLPFKPELNYNSLSCFLQLTYIPAPFTIYKNIFKLESNSFLEIDCSNLLFSINEIPRIETQFAISSQKDAIQKTHDLVRNSVFSRSISDVPVGTFLSGGVDSSIISLCLAQQQANKIDTFSVGFKNKDFNETEKSKLVSRLINSNHHEFIISEKDISSNLDKIINNFDEPFADSSALASYIVANKTSHFVKVALTGDGGDEVFGGYNKYLISKLNNQFIKLIPQNLHARYLPLFNNILFSRNDSRGIIYKLTRLINSISYDDDYYRKIISLAFHKNEINEILNKSILHSDIIEYCINKIGLKENSLKYFRSIDRVLSLEGDMLVKVDRTSMLSSLECRSPFLNKDIWDFTNQLPDSFLINGFQKKYILKQAFNKYFPKNFLNHQKKGFAVPVGDWLRTSLQNELKKYVSKPFLDQQNIFNNREISELVNNHINSKKDNTFKVWTYFCFQKWYTDVYTN